MVHPISFTPDHDHELPDVPLLTKFPFDAELTRCCDAGMIEAYHPEAVDRLLANVQTMLSHME
jgi:hypothetical protein